MGSRHQRVTNGQRAAVCALMLCGQPFIESCKVVGAPYRLIQGVLPPDWWAVRRMRPRKWFGDGLRAVEEAYRDPSIPMETIATAYGLSRRHITSLAVRHGWPRRPRGKGKPLPVPVMKLTPEMRNRFVKLRRIIGRSAAEQAVFG